MTGQHTITHYEGKGLFHSHFVLIDLRGNDTELQFEDSPLLQLLQ